MPTSSQRKAPAFHARYGPRRSPAPSRPGPSFPSPSTSAIIDSLVQMKAHVELKRLASRLERLSFKATPNEEALKPGRKLLRWRIEPVFTPKETRLDFIRAPIASELKRREAD